MLYVIYLNLITFTSDSQQQEKLTIVRVCKTDLEPQTKAFIQTYLYPLMVPFHLEQLADHPD